MRQVSARRLSRDLEGNCHISEEAADEVDLRTFIRTGFTTPGAGGIVTVRTARAIRAAIIATGILSGAGKRRLRRQQPALYMEASSGPAADARRLIWKSHLSTS